MMLLYHYFCTLEFVAKFHFYNWSDFGKLIAPVPRETRKAGDFLWFFLLFFVLFVFFNDDYDEISAD